MKDELLLKLKHIEAENEHIWEEEGPDDEDSVKEIHATSFEWLYTQVSYLITQLRAEIEAHDRMTEIRDKWQQSYKYEVESHENTKQQLQTLRHEPTQMAFEAYKEMLKTERECTEILIISLVNALNEIEKKKRSYNNI